MAQQLSDADREQIATARAGALQQAELAFNQLDTNGDGEVDREEISKLAA